MERRRTLIAEIKKHPDMLAETALILRKLGVNGVILLLLGKAFICMYHWAGVGRD